MFELIIKFRRTVVLSCFDIEIIKKNKFQMNQYFQIPTGEALRKYSDYCETIVRENK